LGGVENDLTYKLNYFRTLTNTRYNVSQKIGFFDFLLSERYKLNVIYDWLLSTNNLLFDNKFYFLDLRIFSDENVYFFKKKKKKILWNLLLQKKQ
jgi:hypothetical protein